MPSQALLRSFTPSSCSTMCSRFVRDELDAVGERVEHDIGRDQHAALPNDNSQTMTAPDVTALLRAWSQGRLSLATNQPAIGDPRKPRAV
jgi:hypothetical protein